MQSIPFHVKCCVRPSKNQACAAAKQAVLWPVFAASWVGRSSRRGSCAQRHDRKGGRAMVVVG